MKLQLSFACWVVFWTDESEKQESNTFVTNLPKSKEVPYMDMSGDNDQKRKEIPYMEKSRENDQKSFLYK